ncbi:unnamed protein product [Caenorhabditis auriculariae]|uniref:G-protein coupled receptors family 1 profile domain-containing protein n=1 Tax=Caenorhabditis auriculariae TaxID=2777116 RepID=A0A8S1HC55_9PELO|nr:unnamed protein product [Caenorhabditis auriculariae]
MLIHLLLLSAVASAVAALTCPTDGIWSEWFPVGRCTANCGSYGTITYRRRCLTEDKGCPCTGVCVMKNRCNTQPCASEDQNLARQPCFDNGCDPEFPLLVDGKCGPQRDCELSWPTPLCEPDRCDFDNLWNPWQAWSACSSDCGQCGTQTRTRTCAGEPHGCTCTGKTREQRVCGKAVCEDRPCCVGVEVERSGQRVCEGTQIRTSNVALIGFILAVTSTYLVFRVQSFRNPFGYLCASHMIADAGVLLIFCVWCAPAVVFGWDSSGNLLDRKLGHLSLFFWFATLYAQIGIAANRFLAINSPGSYRRIFSKNGTFWIISLMWMLPGFHSIIYFFDGCDFTFDSSKYYWSFADTECGAFISFYLDFLYGMIVCIVVLILDIATITKLHLTDSACLTAFVFTSMLISFHVVSRFTVSTLEAFFATTFVWLLAHTLDGVILFAFNSEYRRVVRRPGLLCSGVLVSSVTTIRVNGGFNVYFDSCFTSADVGENIEVTEMEESWAEWINQRMVAFYIIIFNIVGNFGNFHVIYLTMTRKELQGKSGYLQVANSCYHATCLIYELYNAYLLIFGIRLKRSECFHVLFGYVAFLSIQTWGMLTMMLDILFLILLPMRYRTAQTGPYLACMIIPGLLYGAFYAVWGWLTQDDEIVFFCNPPVSMVPDVMHMWVTTNFTINSVVLGLLVFLMVLMQVRGKGRSETQKVVRRLKVITTIFVFSWYSACLGHTIINSIFDGESKLSMFLTSNMIFFVLIIYSQAFYVIMWRSKEYRKAFTAMYAQFAVCRKVFGIELPSKIVVTSSVGRSAGRTGPSEIR